MFHEHGAGLRRRPRALLLAIAVLAVVAASGGTYLGLRSPGSHKSASDASASVALPTTTTVAPAPATTSPTTLAPTAATAPTTTQKPALPDTAKPVALAGGSFVVVSGEVTLTYVVVPGDTLFGISQWFKLMGGVTALYDWNHSTIGTDPNLIYPGEVLTMKVPGADIPKISPMYLADTQEAKKASA